MIGNLFAFVRSRTGMIRRSLLDRASRGVETARIANMIACLGRLSPALVPMVAICGCAPLTRPTVEQQRIRQVYVLPGIEGRSALNVAIADGLADGGVDGAITIHDWATWAGPFGWFVHLTNHRRNRVEAFRLARRIMKHQRTHPGCSIFLVAHSGGAGIALSAVEALSPAMPIDGVILLAAAVSPRRDLRSALERTKLGIWNFSSRRDVAFLMLGTSLFGTMDRTFEPSAGAVGFKLPSDLSEAEADQYARKLHPMPHDRAMAEYGNHGTHNGWAKREFVAAWLAPIIKGDPMPPRISSDDTGEHDGKASPVDTPKH